jgi:hypothetical protein
MVISWQEMGFNIPENEKVYRRWADRDSQGKKVAGGTFQGDYDAWWAKQSKERQDRSSVGPRRAEMLRKGTIEFKDLVDKSTGRKRTIKELEEMKA